MPATAATSVEPLRVPLSRPALLRVLEAIGDEPFYAYCSRAQTGDAVVDDAALSDFVWEAFRALPPDEMVRVNEAAKVAVRAPLLPAPARRGMHLSLVGDLVAGVILTTGGAYAAGLASAI